MQHHTAAILLAFMNRHSGRSFRVRGENKSYDLLVRRDDGDKVEIEVGNVWKCYSKITVEESGRKLSLEIKHPDDSSRTIDTVSIYNQTDVDGVFDSQNGKSYQFAGKFRNNASIFDGVLTKLDGTKADFKFTLV